jgi:hypothetical protein
VSWVVIIRETAGQGTRGRVLARADATAGIWPAALGWTPAAGRLFRRAVADQVKPTSRTKCPSLRLRTPPPAQCTMNASRMMTRMTTTTQKKNTTMAGMAYPATFLALATAASYPHPPRLFGGGRFSAAA